MAQRTPDVIEKIGDLTNPSPMMAQYIAVKEQYPDHILMYRLGDFYEMFFEDAVTVSRELELTLTGRDCGDGRRAAMCGVPFHKSDLYVGKLVELGIRGGRSKRPDLKCGVCGEHGGDPDSVHFFNKIGVDYVSCSPFRVPIARLSAAQAAIKQSA